MMRNAGVDPRRLVRVMGGWRRFLRERAAFRRQVDAGVWPWGRELPVLTEWDDASGSLGAYFFQDQVVARWIHEARPLRHVDVGSRLDGFIGNLAVFREVEVIDIRPPPMAVRNVTFHQVDLMEELPACWVEATDSLSCLHTIEHFGLGRYGDRVEADGYLLGLAQLKRMVKPGGMFYLSTPIGPQRVEFNAHRVFAARTVIDWFAGGWEIERFAVIDDDNRVREDVAWRGAEAEDHFSCRLGVGIVAARKIDGAVEC